jgi:hypothetical protein
LLNGGGLTSARRVWTFARDNIADFLKGRPLADWYSLMPLAAPILQAWLASKASSLLVFVQHYAEQPLGTIAR